MSEFDDRPAAAGSVASTLSALVDRYGPVLFNDPSRLKLLLVQSHPDATIMIDAILAALEAEVPQRLMATHDDASVAALLPRMADHVAQRDGVPYKAAVQAVRAWALALALPDDGLDDRAAIVERPVRAAVDLASVVTPLARDAAPGNGSIEPPRSATVRAPAPQDRPEPTPPPVAPAIVSLPEEPAPAPVPVAAPATVPVTAPVPAPAPVPASALPVSDPNSSPVTDRVPTPAGLPVSTSSDGVPPETTPSPVVPAWARETYSAVAPARPAVPARRRGAVVIVLAVIAVAVATVFLGHRRTDEAAALSGDAGRTASDRPYDSRPVETPTPVADDPPRAEASVAPSPLPGTTPPTAAPPPLPADELAAPSATPTASAEAVPPAAAPAELPVDAAPPLPAKLAPSTAKPVAPSSPRAVAPTSKQQLAITRIDVPPPTADRAFAVRLYVMGRRDAVAAVEERHVDRATGRSVTRTLPASALGQASGGVFTVPVRAIPGGERPTMDFVLVDRAGVRSAPKRVVFGASKAKGGVAERGVCSRSTCGSVAAIREVGAGLVDVIVRMDDRSIVTTRQTARPAVGSRVRRAGERYVSTHER